MDFLKMIESQNLGTVRHLTHSHPLHAFLKINVKIFKTLKY